MSDGSALQVPRLRIYATIRSGLPRSSPSFVSTTARDSAARSVIGVSDVPAFTLTYNVYMLTLVSLGNYAHGKHELKQRHTTLIQMERSGQIVNAGTYLSRPCMTWVSTGCW